MKDSFIMESTKRWVLCLFLALCSGTTALAQNNTPGIFTELNSDISNLSDAEKLKVRTENDDDTPLKYEAKFQYRHDQFTSGIDSWNFIEVDLQRSTTIGSIIGRIRYANRFNRNGVQYEIDAYPTISDELYAYVNAGVSTSSIFPDYRLGLNLYKSLPNAFEGDAGLRYLNFSPSDVVIYTAALSKYYRNYFFTARTYVTPKSTGTSASFSLQARKYFYGPENYLNLRVGYGSAQEELRFQELTQRLNSWSLSARILWELNPMVQLGGSLGYDTEKFPDFRRNRISFETAFYYRF